ncbi:MAG: ATP-dependent helicase [Nanoarchaeota archaeon]
MISYLNKPHKDEDIFDVLHPIVITWFKNKFKTFSDPQKYAVLPIHNRENVLVSAVTGSGKTLTGFMAILNELITLADSDKLENKVYCIYTSPLKALVNDINVNLEQPLKEMEELAKKKFKIKIGVRTGDTTASEKQKMLKETPHILVTTPESLALILTSPKFRDKLKDVRYLIIDEVHSLAENKRGVYLSISIERLHELAGEFTKIGLSATAEPIEEIAKFVVGNNRECKIAKIDSTKKMDLKVLCPLPDLINTTFEETHNAMYDIMHKLIQDHKTTLIFTNTRSATERVVHYLKEKFPKHYTENIGAHHGSLSKEHRWNIEKRMREGELKAIVCSTSLELGIDIGYIDLVIMLGSPKSVARASQRVGRSGHRLHDVIKGRIIVLDRDDLIESSVMLKNVLERNIDKIHIPRNCLDVLAQQIYGIAISDQIHIDSLLKLIKRSYCYRDLSKEDFNEVIKYLTGFYSTLEDRNVYAKIWYDEETGMIGKKGKLARVIYMTNIGTIPDETFITVKIGEQSIGHLDENFLEKMKRGDVFTLGGNTYEFQFSRGMVAQVKASPGRTPTIPNWVSEMLPLSFDLALEIGKFRRLMEEKFKNKTKKEIIEFIDSYLYVDKNAALAIYNYFNEQYLYLKEIPNDKKILIEHYNEDNKKYVIFHALFGRRVNDCLSRAIAYAIGKLQHKDVEIGINDNGFFLSYEGNAQVLQAFKLLKSEKIRLLLELAIKDSEIFKRRFRHCATRSLMILREYKGRKKRVGRQQVSSMLLISALRRISEDFSILKEAKREVLEDLMDIENTTKVLKQIEDNEIKIKEVNTSIPSPFGFNLVLQGYLDILKIEDKIKFLRNMHTLVLAKIGKEHEIEYEN